MLDFSEISLSMQPHVEKIFIGQEDRGCEYTFGNVYIWRDFYDARIAFPDAGSVVVRFNRQGEAYLVPCGGMELRQIMEEMILDSRERRQEFRMIAASDPDTQRLERLFPGRFSFHPNRDYAEYVYNSQDLIHLPGRKYHGKRNHISQFVKEHPDYVFEEITRDNVQEVRRMCERWYHEQLSIERIEILEPEMIATFQALDHLFELSMKGGFIRTGGEVVAFAIGEAINDRTFCVHIEKAFYHVTGAYSVINRDFTAHFCPRYEFVNREDDIGQQGLRRSKLSYHPAYLLNKNLVTLAQDPFQKEE